LRVRVLERAAELGEIGAGIQLGPNAFCAFDALGIGDRVVQEKLGLFREERSSAPCEPM